jgi:hypothetical protein
MKFIGCLISTLFVFVAACASEGDLRPGAKTPESVTNKINLSGFPPEFRRGFTDGCSAARAKQSAVRPQAEGQYAVGWQDGFDYCRSKE